MNKVEATAKRVINGEALYNDSYTDVQTINIKFTGGVHATSPDGQSNYVANVEHWDYLYYPEWQEKLENRLSEPLEDYQMQAELETTLLADKFMAELSAVAGQSEESLKLFLETMPGVKLVDLDSAFATGSNLDLNINLEAYMTARSININQLKFLKGLNQ